MGRADFVAALHDWQAFYSLIATAAATLTGLMFLAVTFGSGLVTKENASQSRAFVDPTFAHFVQVFLIACIMVAPTMTQGLLGSLLVAVAVLRLLLLIRIFVTLRKVHRARGDLEPVDWLIHIVLPMICHSILLATGAAFLAGRADAFAGLAIFCLLLLALGILSTWELLVWMAVEVNEPKNPGT